MSNKHKVPLGLQQEFDDVDYWHKLSRKKYVEMPDGTKITEYEWMKRFMHEYYGNKFDRHDDSKNIIQTEELKKEARRNHNNTHRDALLVSKKMGALNVLFEMERNDSKEEESWEETFKVGSYQKAIKELIQKCCEELNLDFTKLNVRKLFRVYFRLTKFVRMIRVDKRNKGRNNE